MPNEVVSSLDKLFPPFAEQVKKFEGLATELNFYIYETYRSFQRQEWLYKKGRMSDGAGQWVVTDKSAIVTNAKPGYSFHAYGLAFDAIVDGDCTKQGVQWSWKDTYKDRAGVIRKVPWKDMGKISKDLGLEWAGDWRTFTEYPHSQNRFGFLISDLYPILVTDGLDAVWKKIYKKIPPSKNIIAVPGEVYVPIPPKKELDLITKTETSKTGKILNAIYNIFNVHK